jgi:hypothetical protein
MPWLALLPLLPLLLPLLPLLPLLALLPLLQHSDVSHASLPLSLYLSPSLSITFLFEEENIIER